MKKKFRAKFICTGLCGEEHPVHGHCCQCSHANFETRERDAGRIVLIRHNMMFGCTFIRDDKMWYPGSNEALWAVADRLMEYAERSCAYWQRKEKGKVKANADDQ